MRSKKILAPLTRIMVKRKYKDILFRFVFREKVEILQLYNAINHTNHTNPDELNITTMEDVIYIGMKNDLSFLIANDLNLYEHQSTINNNMPLRGLLYLAKMYESYIETNNLNRYQNKLIKLPFPRFIVFYNGEEEMADTLYMRLSDAFEVKLEEPAVECVARFININYGHNKELLDSCKRLHDYSYFVNCVRNYLKKGFARKEAVLFAVEECIEKGILKDVLVKHRAEVVDMFLTTFDKKMYERAVRDEAREAGLEEGRMAGLEEGRMAGLEAGRIEGRMEGRALLAKTHAQRLRENGVPYELAIKIITEIDESDLQEIYGK